MVLQLLLAAAVLQLLLVEAVLQLLLPMYQLQMIPLLLKKRPPGWEQTRGGRPWRAAGAR